ncbi:MAG: family 10 glycosylhydrolase, partial [Phycisphaerae bacterium]|nr:family 10 glycosylhydrolase [Phycisphaerae bacterium]
MQNNPRRRRRHLGVSVCALCIGLVAASASGVIVDNVDPGFTVLSGSWSIYAAVGSWGDNYRFKQTNETAVTGEVEWRPNLPEAGVFTVWVWYRASETARPNNARYTVYYDGGSQAVYVNQQVNGSRWVELGSYPFAAGTAGRVTLVDQAQADRNVVADAVRFDVPPPEFRAFWADVFHYGLQDAAQIDEMIARAVEGKYNAIIPEVLAYHDNVSGSHGAYWESDIVARSPFVTGGFDPLAYMVQQAHANGLEIHPWIVAYRVSSAWPPPGNDYLAAHPDWLMVPQAAMGSGPAPVGGVYTFDPGNPEVQEYLVSIVKELVTNYAIDGIHWDYIRYTQSDAGYPADATSTNSGLARFQAINGQTDVPPPTGDAPWDTFRRRTITELIRRVQAEIPMITSNPQQPLRHSASLITWGDAPYEFEDTSAYARFQNWGQWMERGYLDTAVPMCYYREHDVDQQQWYRNWVDAAMVWCYDRALVIGPGIYMNTMANSVTQLLYARNAGADGLATYSYGSTVDSNTDGTPEYDPAWYPLVASEVFRSSTTVPAMPWRDPATATEGTLYGQILSFDTGEPVDNVTVQVGYLDPVQTDGNGYYVVTMIPATAAGTSYDVMASGAGHKAVTIPGVQVVAGDVRRQDLEMEVSVTLIIDNVDPGFTILSGSWSTIDGGEEWGPDYRLCSTNTEVTGEAEWRPVLPETGTYAVSVWYRSVPTNRATNARHTVHHVDGDTDVYVNQKLNGGVWVPLGTYGFAAGTSGYVTLVNQTDQLGVSVCADAVRFELVAITGASLTMAVSPAGAGTTSPAIGTYPYDRDEIVPVATTALPGYVFDHWEVSIGSPVADPSSPTTTVTMDRSKTVTAVFASGPEYRAFWVDAWGAGLLNQDEVELLLGEVGNPNSGGRIRDVNCNTVIVQVRRRADVCYPSGMGEPYMSGLTPADFNALQALIDAAHDTTGGKKRIEVHCWLVAFKTAHGQVYSEHSDPSDLENYWPTRRENGTENGDGAFDPGHPRVLEYLTGVYMDLVNNFDIDGIHHDYIRFEANTEGYNPTSVARYNERYGLTGQPSSSSDQFKQWRRDQVTAVVRKVHANIQKSKPWVKHSGSFVTWNPSPVASTREAFMATRPYYDVYSDWDSWVEEGLVDMAVPMTYYREHQLPTDYVRWMNFEKDRKFNRQMIIGPGIYMNWLSNAILHLQKTREPSPAGNYADGFSGYSYRSPYMVDDSPLTYGVWDDFAPSLKSGVTPTWVDVPEMPWKTAPTTGHIMGTITHPGGAWADHAIVSITGPASRSLYVDGTGSYAFIDLPTGLYTITASKSGYPDAVTTANVEIGVV